MIGKPIVSLIGAALAALSLSACATLGAPGPVSGDSVGAVRTGIAGVRDEAKTSFAAADLVALQQDIEWRVAQPGLTLAETDFTVPVTPADAQAWDTAFSALDAYCAALQKLVASDTSTGAGDAIAGLGQQMTAGPIKAAVPGAVQAIFATFGEALIQAKDEKAAADVMRKVDPAFQTVTTGMADAIGASPAPGNLQFTVKANWTTVLARISAAYAAAPATDQASRRAQIQNYIAALAGRDAQLAELTELHGSLLALGQAHAAAAKGKPADAAFWIARINGWVDEIKQRDAAAQQSKAAK